MDAQQTVPFVDLACIHRELEYDLVAVLREALGTAAFIGGPAVEGFEREFAKFCQTKHCVGVGSGTDALRFALMAMGIGEGNSVITVPNTFIATSEAISQAGAVPEFVDISQDTYNLDANALKAYLSDCPRDSRTGRPISKRTGKVIAAVIPVHLYGQVADVDTIQEIADLYNIAVLEDACQAHGAEYFSRRHQTWKKAGSMGQAAAFSFYPGKNLGACGEAGAVTTNDSNIAAIVRRLRDHGQAQKYYHDSEGYNGRLDAIQAGFLRVKLQHLPEWTSQRRAKAQSYNSLLASAKAVITPFEPQWSRAVYHLYVVRVHDREQVISHLKAAGISTGIHYPIPLHFQKAYQGLGYQPGDFPVTEKIASEILSLPMYPQLTEEQQRYVADVLSECVSSKVESSEPSTVAV